MELKNKTKFLLVLGIIFVSFLLFNTNTVNATTEISDYKCKIEKDGIIVYNNYFNTKDVTFEKSYNRTYINIYNVDKSKFNEILNNKTKENNWLILVEIDNSVDSVKLQDKNENLEILELNNKKYAVINGEIGDTCDTEIFIYGVSGNLELTKGEVKEIKTLDNLFIDIFDIDYIDIDINIVSENNVVYGNLGISNGNPPQGVGLEPIPSKIDFNKSYVEYLSNSYMGSVLKDGSYNVPYIGKYGNQYKYKMSLQNVKVNEIGQNISYNNVKFNDGGSFNLDQTYTIDNETYIEQTKTNTDTKLKFDLWGNFKGTVKAEEISKNDLIYNKVNEELKKYSKDNIYMNISNIYIENGSYEGPLKLTFHVGEQYNGKYYSICHMKDYMYSFEKFNGIVENGKIEITVDSLSPFGISIFEKKEETPTTDSTPKVDKGEKDETPKTGTVDIIGYVLGVTLLTGVGIVELKKRLK